MDRRWHIPSVQESGVPANTVVSADGHAGVVLVGTAGRSLTRLHPEGALALSDALREAAQVVDPEAADADHGRTLLDALQRYIAGECDR